MINGELKNGLRYIIAPRKGELITVLILFDVGAKDENISGISHFLEHMIFKGSQEHSNNVKVFQAFDAIGAHFNAFTVQDQTGYFVKFQKGYLEYILETLMELLNKPLLNEDDIDNERPVIMEEIRMVENNPRNISLINLHETIFKGHPLSNSVSGNQKTLDKINRRRLREYHKYNYCPKKIIAVIVGNVLPVKNVINILQRFKWEKKCPLNVLHEHKPRSEGPYIIINDFDLDQEHIAIGFPLFGYPNKRRYAAELLNIILGTGMTSRLFSEIREKRGLVYKIYSELKFYRQGGFLFIKTMVIKKNVNKVLNLIFNILKDLKENPVSSEELKRSKTHLEGQVHIKEEDLLNVALLYGIQALYLEPKILTFQQIVEKIKKVGAKEIQQLAQSIFLPKTMVVSIVGKTKKKEIKFLLCRN